MNEIIIEIRSDSLGHQVNLWEDGVWDESSFRTFNEDDYPNTHWAAKTYAVDLFDHFSGGAAKVGMYDESEGETTAFLPAKEPR